MDTLRDRSDRLKSITADLRKIQNDISDDYYIKKLDSIILDIRILYLSMDNKIDDTIDNMISEISQPGIVGVKEN